MYERDPSFEGYSMVYCRSSVRELRKLRNPSACDLSRKSPIPSSAKCLRVLGGSLYKVRAVFSKSVYTLISACSTTSRDPIVPPTSCE